MENLSIKAGQRLPMVEFNADTGILEIKGRSLQGSDPLYKDLYDSIFDWLDKYIQQPAPKTVISVQLEYFCTATSKNLLNIFQILEKVFLAGHDVSINWYCPKEDEDITEAGYEYKELLKVPVTLINY
ncbi:MAG: DUF1987 domain-containing protein [Bacteroidales bacterium]